MNQADTAWMLIATALVLLMTPALGFFYGGLVRSKNALNTMMMSFISLGFVAVLWAVAGYSLAFAPGNNWIGDGSRFLLRGVGLEPQGTIPHLLFMCFQGTFAIITAALISGAIVERMRFSAYVVFISMWALLVYSPIAHWVWGGGWLADMGALDFAGGTVVHVNAGAAALVAALVDRQAQRLQVVRPRAAQRAVHPARRRRALVRLVRVQRGKRGRRQQHRRARLRDDHAGAGGHPGGLDAPRRRPSAEVHRGRRRHRHRRRARRGHAGRRLRGADERDSARRDCRRPQLLRAGLARQDAAGRLARRRRGPRRRRHGRRAADRCLRAEGPQRRGGRALLRQSRAARASRPSPSGRRLSTAGP